jgi:hypothetical protein
LPKKEKHTIKLDSQKYEYFVSENDLIELRFSGKDIIPQNLSSKEVAGIIREFEEALFSIVSRDNPEINKDDLYLGLVKVENKSAGYVFEPKVKRVYLPAFLLLATSLKQHSLNNLPLKTIESLNEISQFSKRRNCSAHFGFDKSIEEPLATITPDYEIDIRDDFYITGTTALYGEVQRVGGADPKVALRPYNQEKIIYCPIDQNLAKELAGRLYEWVSLTGTAKWQIEDNVIIDFKISRIEEFQPKTNVEAFSELSGVLGEYWDEVDDVDKYLSRDD